MKELNSALGDALAGFDEVRNDQNEADDANLVIDDSPARGRRRDNSSIAAAGGPIKLKLKMFGKTSPGIFISIACVPDYSKHLDFSLIHQELYIIHIHIS